MSDQQLRTLWLGSQMQAIIATKTEDRLTEVSDQADRIHEVTSRAIMAATSTTAKAATPKTLEMQLQELKTSH